MFINAIQWIGNAVLDLFNSYMFNNLSSKILFWNIKIQKYVWALFCMFPIHKSVYVDLDRRRRRRNSLNDVIETTTWYSWNLQSFYDKHRPDI